MSLAKDVEKLFGYDKSESMAPPDLMQSIVDRISPGMQTVGLVAIGGEGAVIKTTLGGAEYAVKVAHPRFVEKGMFSLKIYSYMNYQKDNANSFNKRYVDGTKNQIHVGEQAKDRNFRKIIIPAYVRIIEDPWLAVVMEYVHGVTLLRHLSEKKNFRYSMHLYLRFLECIQFIHICGVIFRDLKPDNIIVTGKSASDPKLCFVDWTLSRITDISTNTLPGALMGTAGYGSDKLIYEQNAAAADESDDVFAAGIMLYEFVNMKKIPTPSGGWKSIIVDKSARHKYLRELEQGIPGVLTGFFNRMTCPRADKRYQRIMPAITEFSDILKKEGFFESVELNSLDFFKVRKMVIQHRKALKSIIKILSEE